MKSTFLLLLKCASCRILFGEITMSFVQLAVRACVVYVAVVFVSLPAVASSQEWTWCDGGAGIDVDRRIAGCTKIIKSGKETPEKLATAFNNRGNAHHNKGDYDLAVQDFDQAIKLSPTFAFPFYNRALSFVEKGEFDRAIGDYDVYVRLVPADPDGFSSRGIAYNDKGDYDRAIQDYDKAISLKADDAGALNNRGKG